MAYRYWQITYPQGENHVKEKIDLCGGKWGLPDNLIKEFSNEQDAGIIITEYADPCSTAQYNETSNRLEIKIDICPDWEKIEKENRPKH